MSQKGERQVWMSRLIGRGLFGGCNEQSAFAPTLESTMTLSIPSYLLFHSLFKKSETYATLKDDELLMIKPQTLFASVAKEEDDETDLGKHPKQTTKDLIELEHEPSAQ